MRLDSWIWTFLKLHFSKGNISKNVQVQKIIVACSKVVFILIPSVTHLKITLAWFNHDFSQLKLDQNMSTFEHHECAELCTKMQSHIFWMQNESFFPGFLGTCQKNSCTKWIEMTFEILRSVKNLQLSCFFKFVTVSFLSTLFQKSCHWIHFVLVQFHFLCHCLICFCLNCISYVGKAKKLKIRFCCETWEKNLCDKALLQVLTWESFIYEISIVSSQACMSQLSFSPVSFEFWSGFTCFNPVSLLSACVSLKLSLTEKDRTFSVAWWRNCFPCVTDGNFLFDTHAVFFFDAKNRKWALKMAQFWKVTLQLDWQAQFFLRSSVFILFCHHTVFRLFSAF